MAIDISTNTIVCMFDNEMLSCENGLDYVSVDRRLVFVDHDMLYEHLLRFTCNCEVDGKVILLHVINDS